jgi:protein-L-isoaspartate(D-aspartate) O-methyltransferase
MTSEPDQLAEYRKAYACEVMGRLGADHPDVEAAFAKVPREAFLGPPPWTIGSGGTAHWTTTADARTLYSDRLVALNRAKGINNGQPSLHALCISALDLTSHDHVLHVGAGTGYYTAIMAECAGSVDAYEIEPDLAVLAARCLAPWTNVIVHADTATGRKLPDADAIYVCAGVTHPDPFWLDALRVGGRLMFPLTGAERWGAMLLVRRESRGFAARFVTQCGFIDCIGLRDPPAAAHLSAVFRAGGQDRVRSLTVRPPADASVWFAGNGWYLSTAELS